MAPSLQARWFFFYVALSVPLIGWMLLIVPDYVGDFANVPSALVFWIVRISPTVGGDISVIGELTPLVLAGSIIALAPGKGGIAGYVAAGLAVVDYFLFVHLSVYFATGAGFAILSADFDDYTAPQKTLLGLISNLRVTSLVVAASLVGINVKTEKENTPGQADQDKPVGSRKNNPESRGDQNQSNNQKLGDAAC